MRALLSADFLAIARAAGRVLRLQGSPFQAKCFFGSTTKGVLSKKSFSFQFKEKKRARDMQWLGP